MWLVAFLSVTMAADLQSLSTSTSGPLMPGVASEVQLVLLEDGEVYAGLLEKADTTGGSLLNLQRLDTGIWQAKLRADFDAESLVLRLTTEDMRPVEMAFEVESDRRESITVKGNLDVVAGHAGTIQLVAVGEDQLEPDDLSLWVSEGEIQAIERSEDGVLLEWRAGDARQPHMALVGIRDQRDPRAMPEWTRVRMRARPPVTVRTEPGTNLTIELGGRRYGPVIAGSDGSVTARVDVYPGEQTATAFLSDSLGNTQETTITIAPEPDPVLGILVDGELSSGRRSPRIYLKAITGSGKDWAGPPPECRAAGGDELEISQIRPSEWFAALSESANRAAFDLRIDCRLGAHQQAAVVPVRRSAAHRVVLQVYPRILSADFPVAQVQAFLEDASGERIGADGVQLAADGGALEDVILEGGSVRANYRGSVSQLGDVLHASYSSDPGPGPAWSVSAGWRLRGERLEVAARVVDSQGRPVANERVRVRVSDEEFTAVSDRRGWVEGEFRAPDGPVVLQAASVLAQASQLVVGEQGAWVSPDAPDLETSQELEFQAGRVSQVFISTEPGFLYGEPGAQTNVQVRLLDRGGRTVTGEPFELRASVGLVEPVKVLADGTYVAVYRPPSGMAFGEVLLSVEGGEGRFGASTTLKIEPRPQRIAIGLAGGYLQGVNGISGPCFTLDVESKLEFLDGLFQARVGLMHWQDRATVQDSSRDNEIDVQLSNYGIGVHLIARREWEAKSSWIGIGGVLAPYSQAMRFEGADSLIGWGIHRPGIAITGGAARRALSGEVYGEVRFLGMNGRAGDIGYDGSVGGIAGILGYRVIL